MITISSSKPYFSKQQKRFVKDSLESIFNSGRLILGPYTRKLQDKFARYTGTKFAVAVSSCTAALEIALRFIDVKDKEVVVPTNTFVASANAVMFAGGILVLADIDCESLCLDVNDFKRRINKKTKAVIVVHVAGLIHPKIREIKKICKSRNIFLIEDVAHAIGSTIDGEKAGTLGDVGCFSFYPTKIITTGTGGMITTDNKHLADYALSVRHHGAGKGLDDIEELGNDWLLDEVRASLGIAQLGEIEKFIAARREIANHYDSEIKNLNLTRLQKFPGIRHVYYKYPIILKNKTIRNKIKTILKNQYGIETGSIYFPPVHQMPIYKKMYTFKNSDFPVANDILPRVLCLPIFVQMKQKEVNFVIESLGKALSFHP